MTLRRAGYAGLRLLFLAQLCLRPGPALADDDAPPTVTPGNVLRFDLGPAEPPAPQARFGDLWLLVANERNRWTVLLGVDIATVPGNYLLAVNHPTTDTLHFSVRARRDPVTRRSADAEAQVEAQLQRIQAGIAKKPEGEARLPLWRPTPARLMDRFGTRQVSPDGSYRAIRHVSFELSDDTPVRAPTSGKVLGVVEIGRGRLVALDHGQGLVSVLWPLHETKVKPGELLKQGATVGVNLVAGGTRSEVNWALLLNRAWVHPLALVAEPEPPKPPPRAAPATPPPKDKPPVLKPRPSAPHP